MITEPWKNIVDEVREHYLNGLQEAVAEFKQEYPQAATELLLEVGRSSTYGFRLYRMDMAANVDVKFEMRECNLLNYVNFFPLSLKPLQGLSLKLSPFTWNGVDFSIDATVPSILLEQWALRWLNVDDVQENNERGFQSVIHSLTEPMTAAGWTMFSVDFGSAPLVAVEELLKLLAGSGATVAVMKSDLTE